MPQSKKPSIFRKFRLIIFIPLILIAIFSWYHAHSEPQTITRAAVDVGSGGLKVTIAKVDPLSQKICKILYAKTNNCCRKNQKSHYKWGIG